MTSYATEPTRARGGRQTTGSGKSGGFLKPLEIVRYNLGGGLKYVLVSPLFGEDSHFD